VVVGVSLSVAEGFVQVSQSTVDGWGVELADALAAAVDRAHGSERYVVEYQLVKDPQGAAHAIAAWTEGVPAALPAVDDLVLVGDGRDVVGVPWPKHWNTSRATSLH
jgi:hypothetical protein